MQRPERLKRTILKVSLGSSQNVSPFFAEWTWCQPESQNVNFLFCFLQFDINGHLRIHYPSFNVLYHYIILHFLFPHLIVSSFLTDGVSVNDSIPEPHLFWTGLQQQMQGAWPKKYPVELQSFSPFQCLDVRAFLIPVWSFFLCCSAQTCCQCLLRFGKIKTKTSSLQFNQMWC